MKKLCFFITFLLLISNFTFACSWRPYSFCETVKGYDTVEHIIIAGIINSKDDDGINIDILHLLKGEESKQTIRVWDGLDFDCNGPHSMSAFGMGRVNDTLIVVLPRIIEPQLAWEVAGDYSRPFAYGVNPELPIDLGYAIGFIEGDDNTPSDEQVWFLPFKEFIDSWKDGTQCVKSTPIEEQASLIDLTIPNPIISTLPIQFSQTITQGSLQLYDLNGTELYNSSIQQQNSTEIDVSHLPKGIYLLRIETLGKQALVRKITKF